MIAFLLLTAFTVSIDSFVCGFTLSLKKEKKYPIVIIITLTVFIACLITNYSAYYFSTFLNEKTASFGGLILIGVGVYNLFKKDKPKNEGKGIFKESVLIGVAVGIDGALANMSLSLMGINAFYVPVTIALMHALTISFGIILSKFKIVKKVEKFRVIPPLILITLGIYKLIGFFV